MDGEWEETQIMMVEYISIFLSPAAIQSRSIEFGFSSVLFVNMVSSASEIFHAFLWKLYK